MTYTVENAIKDINEYIDRKVSRLKDENKKDVVYLMSYRGDSLDDTSTIIKMEDV